MKTISIIMSAIILSLALASCAGGGTVDITYKQGFFGEDMSDFDPDAYAQENGFEKAVVNDDGTVTITMSQAKYNELKKELTDSLEQTFADMVNDEDVQYIKEITHNDDFTVVTVKVDRAGYEAAFFDVTPFSIGMSVMVGQMAIGEDQKVTVNMVDADTNDTISSVTYPDALNAE